MAGEKNQNLADCRAAAVMPPRSFTPGSLPDPGGRRPSGHAVVAVFPPAAPPATDRHQPAGRRQPHGEAGRHVEVHPFATIAADVEIGPGSTIHSGRAHHGRLADRRRRDHLPQRRALRGHRRRPALRDPCLRRAGGLRLRLFFRQRPPPLSAQLGHVVLEADVEIGAGTTIDRGTYGPTVIGEGTRSTTR